MVGWPRVVAWLITLLAAANCGCADPVDWSRLNTLSGTQFVGETTVLYVADYLLLPGEVAHENDVILGLFPSHGMANP